MVELTINQLSFENFTHVVGPGGVPGDVVAFLDNSVKEIENGIGEVGDPVLSIIDDTEMAANLVRFDGLIVLDSEW